MVDNPAEVKALPTERPHLYQELPTKDTTPEVSRSLQEQDEASLSGGDSQSGGASGDHDIAPQPDRPPLTDDELSSEPVRHYQKISRGR